MCDIQQFEEFKYGKIDEIQAIRNELANDGLIYINYVRPIFKEAVEEAIVFFDSWGQHASTME